MHSKTASSFTTTKWSMILHAGDSEDPGGREALEILCQRYWPPVYSYIRHRGYDKNATEDLTQSFFAQLLEKRSLKAADPERGRFRAFLLTSVRNFLSDSRDKDRTQKRGGDRQFLPLDFSGIENFKYEPTDEITPEALFERQWANSVLAEVFDRLRQEAMEAQALERFERLEGFLTGELEGTRQSRVAEELGMNAETLRVAIHRLRKRFGRLLRERVAQTVADPEQVDDEIRFLLTTLNS
jgi:RNA polymerase sigma-70 factor (ECF subfamily)